MKTERKMNWLCAYCHNLLEGTVTIDIPSKDFVDPEGTYNCCNLYCDNCKQITAHINVDAGMGKLIQLLNSHHFITDNSCEGHAVLFNFDSHKHYISKVDLIAEIVRKLDLRYPYFCIEDSHCVDFDGYYSRVPTLEIFKIFRSSGFTDIRFVYYSGPDATTGEYTREEFNESISTKYMTNKKLALIADIYANKHGRDLRVSYSLEKSATYLNEKILNDIFNINYYKSVEDISAEETAFRIVSDMEKYFKKNIDTLYKNLLKYFANEKDVELKRAPGIESIINEMMKDKEETQ